ncbi:MAG: hypothetical protein HYX55_00150 [Chloroflexi bacterium]|nr:hypothetical protein [Chloroflexota bacterium]
MAGTEPRKRQSAPATADASADGAARRLERPPSERYAAGQAEPAPGTGGSSTASPSALSGPLVRALLVGALGTLALFVVGALLASTAGLLFTSGAVGGAAGLVLARAAVPLGEARPVSRRTVARLSVAVAIAAVAIAAISTWAFARAEGGNLGLVDYLLEAFGLFVPGEVVIAAAAAVWGANAGPVQS